VKQSYSSSNELLEAESSQVERSQAILLVAYELLDTLLRLCVHVMVPAKLVRVANDLIARLRPPEGARRMGELRQTRASDAH
jgi:hypothetical protein